LNPLSWNFFKPRFLLLILNPVKEIEREWGIWNAEGGIWNAEGGMGIADFGI
jgi:hypothetical protein